MKWRFGLCALAFALILQAQTQMNVEQLADFIRSELALRQHTDKQIAAALKKIQLSEKLTDKTITDLQAQGAQPKTVEALRKLRDESASLKRSAPSDVTSSPATAPDNTLTAGPQTATVAPKPVAPPPPDSVHQQQIIDQMRQYALTYTQSMPNYICVRVDRRFVDPSGGDRFHNLGTILAKVSYNEGQERNDVYSVGGQIVDAGMGGIGVRGGARSSGEFAEMMKDLFEPRSQTEFGWERWTKLRGRVLAVYNYFIDSGHSSISISYGDGRSDDQRIVTAYRGLVYTDPNTGEIDRITFNAVDIPASFPVRSASERIDYDLVKIGDQQAILPLQALLRMTTLHDGSSRNEIEFRNYKKFGTEVKIEYDMANTPLPESKTQEQPLSSSTNSGAENEPKQPAQPAGKQGASPQNNSSPWMLPTPPPPPPK